MKSNIIDVIRKDEKLRNELVSAIIDDVVDRITDIIKNEIESYANSNPALTRRTMLKTLVGSILLLSGIERVSARSVLTEKALYIDDKEAVIVPRSASDGQIIVRENGEWKLADPSVDKWAGQQLTPRDITLDLKRLTDNTLAYFQSFRVFTPNFFKPVRTFNLYLELTSDSPTEEYIEVRSGTGANTDTVHYVQPGEIVWVESAGLLAEFSSTPDVVWNDNKYIKLSRKHYPYGSSTPTQDVEYYGGKATNEQNWRHITALSESFYYIDNNRVTAKAHARYDLIATSNYHYWFRHEKGDEYIRLSADAGCFTFTSDQPVLYMKGMVFNVEDILVSPQS